MSLDSLMSALKQNAWNLKQKREEDQQKMGQMLLQQANVPGVDIGRANKVKGKRGPGPKGAKFAGPNPLGSMMDPIKGIKVTSNYGPRINPISHKESNHTGVDFGAGMGTPIYAAQSGFVKRARHGDPVYGNQIVLGHGHGFQTMYGHMENFIVKPGQHVRKGQVIGYVGSTGWSTGPHLHFETWKRGKPMNPMQFV